METRNLYKVATQLSFTVVLLLLASGISAQVRKSDHLTKSFKVATGVSVEIENKYGDVRIETWTKDSVRVEIDLDIEAKTDQLLERTLREIRFDVSGTEYFVTAKTVIEGQRTSLIQELENLADLVVSGGTHVTVNYRVFLPKSSALEVENRFGNIFLGGYSSDVTIELAHGDLFANELLGKTDITVSFGKGKINKLKTAKLEMEYSDFRINEAQLIHLSSKQSDIDIRQVGDLNCQSRRDKIHLDEVQTLRGSATFSDFYVRELKQSVTMSMKYGSLNIEGVPVNFSAISVTADNTDVSLRFVVGTSYKVDMTLDKVQLSYPESKAKLEKRHSQTDTDVMWVTGSIGSGTASNTVKIDARNCGVYLIH